jgi:hypothetical protein
VDGSKQKYGIHYDETYSPVVQWSSTRFFLIQALLNNWYTHQIDFVLAYAQAPVERELYMEIPKGVNLEGADFKDYVLESLKNLYGQKQAGPVWYNHLVNGLLELGFVCNTADKCVFYYNKSILLIYVDDSILLGPDGKELKKLKELIASKFDIQKEEDLSDNLGIQIKKQKDGTLTLTQPHLIVSILKDLKLNNKNTTGRKTPALKTVLILKDMLCTNVLDLVLVQSNLMQKQSSTFAGTLQEQRIKVSLSDQKGIPLNAFGVQNFRQRFPFQPLKPNTLSYHVQYERSYPFFHLRGRQLRRE